MAFGQGGRGKSLQHTGDPELMGRCARQGERYHLHKRVVQSHPQIPLTHSRGEGGLIAVLSPAYAGRPTE